MVFSSLEFLFLFLPATLIVYFVTPLRARNLALLAVSLIFYGWGGIEYVPLMVGVILIDYVCGLLIGVFSGRPALRRTVLIAAVAANLAVLGFYKYADFIIESIPG